MNAAFPQALVQTCIINLIRNVRREAPVYRIEVETDRHILVEPGNEAKWIDLLTTLTKKLGQGLFKGPRWTGHYGGRSRPSTNSSNGVTSPAGAGV